MAHYNIKNGLNIISIHNAGIIEYLQIKKPKVVRWYDCRGTVAEYFVTLPEEYKITDDFINSIGYNFTNKEDELIEQFQPLLNLFQDGEYEILFHAGKVPPFFVECVTRYNKNYWAFDLCDDYTYISKQKEAVEVYKRTRKYETIIENSTRTLYEPTLIATQPRSIIDEKRVQYYEEKIKTGERPFAIVFHVKSPNDNHPAYVIDGHHKLLAYKRLCLFPHLVEITLLRDDDHEDKIDIKALIERLYPWQIEDMLKNSYNKEIIFAEAISDPRNPIHRFL